MAILNFLSTFITSGIKRSILLICILISITVYDFISLGLTRRTFIFYTLLDGVLTVEDRMLKKADTREENIIRYTEEVLLGPVAQDRLRPLFPRETRLKSLLFRDGIVYIDFSSDAAMPPIEGGQVKSSFNTLYEGILRNFTYVKDISFFIEGQSVFSGEFGSI